MSDPAVQGLAAATAESAAPACDDLPLAHRPCAAGKDRVAAFAEVAVFDSLEAAGALWDVLAAKAPVSPYQTRAWLRAWIETEGVAHRVRPFVVAALEAGGCPVAILPLGLCGRAGVRRASFLGGVHANYNMGLFDPAVAWSEADLRALLHQAARNAPTRVDVFAFVNQPLDWRGLPNPLALLPGQLSPSFCHSVPLRRDGEAFLRDHLSAAARKKMRSKRAQLEALGPVSHRIARSSPEIEATLAAHVSQKAAKLNAIGVESPGALSAQARLLARAARDTAGAPAPLELHALYCGERIVATFGGLTHAGRVSGLVISHEGDPAIARFSPGELLLADIVRQKCAEGLDSFDLGVGEARYKQGFCPIDDPLVDSFVPVTARGRLFVAQDAVRLRIKRRIKQSAWAWAAARRARRWLGRLRRAL